MVVKEKILNHLDKLAYDLQEERKKVSSGAARSKYNSMINIVQNIFKDVEDGVFD